MFEQVQVPEAVVAELEEGHRLGIALPKVGELPWMAVRSVSGADLLIESLGKGEAEIIALGLKSPNALIVMDDREARRAAVGAGLAVIGTVGTLLLAKEQGCIDTVGPVLERLQSSGFRLSNRVHRAALIAAGESD